MRKFSIYLSVILLALFISTSAFAIQWPTIWKGKFTNWEYFNPNAVPGQVSADGIEDNWGIARMTSIYDLTDPNQPQVWSDVAGDNNSLRIFFWGLDLAEWDNNTLDYKMHAADTGAYLELYEWNEDWDVSIVDPANRTSTEEFAGITNGGTLLARFEFTYGVVPGDNETIAAGRTNDTNNPPQGDGQAYLKVVPNVGTMWEIFDQDRNAVLAAMAADGIVPQDPDAIDPEADIWLKFSFSPDSLTDFDLKSEDPVYGATPEPATLVLLGAGMLLVGSVVRKRTK
ncbi:PEP-CTERM sorting domain-containing protein [Thermodesulfatator atlanticus]|uniref:PEP-CTERM sorting domain-containing protein n=1 Tax=Thermodesulfatator atlanticus TaxID=501497 RepID=UPI0003B63066|nr:PEP-CTERM sorting domain-containing protein [Thermodesulfatator atlanticus]